MSISVNVYVLCCVKCQRERKESGPKRVQEMVEEKMVMMTEVDEPIPPTVTRLHMFTFTACVVATSYCVSEMSVCLSVTVSCEHLMFPMQ